MSILRLLIGACALSVSVSAQSGPLGLFTNAADVGRPPIAGSASFDAATGQYRITGGGANIWGKQDQFHYVWKETTGGFTVTATAQFVGQGADFRKAAIMVRQSLDADSAFADVVAHGNGTTSLQWRSRKGEDVNTFDLPTDGPGTFTIKLVRNGVRIFLYVGKNGAEVKEIVHTEVSFQNPVLVGLAVCAHDAKAAETVLFSNVSIDTPPPAPAPAPALAPRAP